MTSGAVQKAFQNVIADPRVNFAKVSKQDLMDCCKQFGELIIRRNALIHAHPCSDSNDAQVLAYQTKPSRALPDMKWPTEELEKLISIFDAAACSAGEILDKLR